MNNQHISLLVTGGTLDKDYNALNGELEFSHTHLNAMLKQANCTLDIDVKTLMLKDSLEMNEDDREQILQACIDTDANKIVITHGTDTMANTAQHLQKSHHLNEKCIVITGAMRPFKLGESDAIFNLGSALSAVQLANNGIYICMNAKLFKADQVIKNRQLGVFEKL